MIFSPLMTKFTLLLFEYYAKYCNLSIYCKKYDDKDIIKLFPMYKYKLDLKAPFQNMIMSGIVYIQN